MSRRQVVQWFVAASAAMTARGLVPATAAEAGTAASSGKGYGPDPVLTKLYKPGDVWPLTLNASQQRTVKALSDVILPADDLGPAASAVGVPEFIDEWISAPYPDQIADRPIMLDGLEWLEKESNTRFNKAFADLSEKAQHAICDNICHAPSAKPEFAKGAAFFLRFRSLASGGYYATEQGWKAIGFVGNLTMAAFEGPPPEILVKVGVEQTVK